MAVGREEGKRRGGGGSELASRRSLREERTDSTEEAREGAESEEMRADFGGGVTRVQPSSHGRRGLEGAGAGGGVSSRAEEEEKLRDDVCSRCKEHSHRATLPP